MVLASQLVVVVGGLVVSPAASNLADNPSPRKTTILPRKSSRKTTGKAIVIGGMSTRGPLMRQSLAMLDLITTLLVCVDGV